MDDPFKRSVLRARCEVGQLGKEVIPMAMPRAFVRLTAWCAGVAPTDVWSSYRQFEVDCEVLVALLEELGDSVKPILEDRARAAKGEATAATSVDDD